MNVEAALTGLAEMRVSAYDRRNPEYIAWEGRNWAWLLIQLISEEMKDFGIPNLLNLEASDEYFFVGYGTSAAIGRQEVGAGSVYFLSYKDTTGAYLDGGKTYKLNVNLFTNCSNLYRQEKNHNILTGN